MLPKTLTHSLLCYLSALAWQLLWIIAKMTISLFKKDSADFKSRILSIRNLQSNYQNSKSAGILYFCSSAGEYEQILPIIDRVSKQHSTFGQSICFFSSSGIKFAEKRREKLPYFLFPSDRPSDIEKILQLTNTTLTVVDRWEFWPNFLRLARKKGPLILVNFSDPSEKVGLFRKKVKSTLLSQFDQIFCIDEHELKKLQDRYGIRGSCIPDTKYDRVLDRRMVSSKNAKNTQGLILPRLKSNKVLVLGSSWPADHDIVLPAFKTVKSNLSAIVCMHEPSETHLKELESALNDLELTFQRLSTKAIDQKVDVLIIDQVGILGEVYSCGDLAWVGGACHHRVHNVLEPAAYNLPVAFGPNFHSSIEACKMVEYSCAEVIKNGDQLMKWLKTAEKEKSQTEKFVKNLAGGAEQLTQIMTREIINHEQR